MTRKITGILSAGIILSILWANAVIAAEKKDFKGSKDHPFIPRVQDSYIIGYQFDEFNDVELILGPAKQVKKSVVPEKSETQEGRRTRIIYVAPKKRSTLEILRNYQ